MNMSRIGLSANHMIAMDIRLPLETSISQAVVGDAKHLSSSHANGSNQDTTTSKLAKPLHLQRLEKALSVDLLIRQVESYIGNKSSLNKPEESLLAPLSKQQTRTLKTRAYNLSKVKKSKKWLKNLLLEKSSSDDSDLEDTNGNANGNLNESVQDMLKFHNIGKKVKRQFEAGHGEAAAQYRNYSASMLASSSGQSLLFKNSTTTSTPTPEPPTATKAKRAPSKARKRPAPPPPTFPIEETLLVSPAAPGPSSTTVIATSPAPDSTLMVKVESATSSDKSNLVSSTPDRLPTAIKIEPVDTLAPSVSTAPLQLGLAPPLSPSLSMGEAGGKRIKLESMVDEIVYDACLPDEILQSESSVQSEAAPSCPPSIADEIVYSNQLPDDIFDSEEESSASVPSMCMSQPPSSSGAPVVHPPPKSATAPTTPTNSCPPSPSHSILGSKKRVSKKKAERNAAKDEATMASRRRRLWVAVVRKEIPRQSKQIAAAKKETLVNCKRMATWCQREKRKVTLVHDKQFCHDQYSRARRLSKEMMVYWKHFERVEKDYRKRAEKEAQEQLRIDCEMLEAKRQQRKLNFLITQTELYAHFMSKKLTNDADKVKETILSQLNEEKLPTNFELKDDYCVDIAKSRALENAESAFKVQQSAVASYDASEGEVTVPSSVDGDAQQELEQPTMFDGLLKSYQLKGINWLYNLFQNGINGILADEMGLGKTIQTIAFLATLAEKQNIWGPFLVVAPASTLHNWQQELSRFTPKFKVLPYWGNPNDRKALRKFWGQKYLCREEATFHVLITSYQLIVQDVKYFQRIKWMYMVLDEAQAIKSAASARWKVLLQFQCRNRLLLSGTPIQNTMAELWALLHFIMPTLFDSHDEFSEWFAKDIESHAENKSIMDEKHLSRLHMILKPFMLRRVKKDVENELSDKIEIQINCGLTRRQRDLYQGLKNKISIEELMQGSNSSSGTMSQVPNSKRPYENLLNLVMQFRKVCNHPDLFERRDVWSPLVMKLPQVTVPSILYREGLICGGSHAESTKDKILNSTFNIYSCHRVNEEENCFSAIKATTRLSQGELFNFACGGLVEKFDIIRHLWGRDQLREVNVLWRKEKELDDCDLLVPLISRRLEHSFGYPWTDLMFARRAKDSLVYGFADHVLNYHPETAEHREFRARKKMQSAAREDGVGDGLIEAEHVKRPPRVMPCEATSLPRLVLLSQKTKVTSAPIELFFRDAAAVRARARTVRGGSERVWRLLNHGDSNCDTRSVIERAHGQLEPQQLGGLVGARPVHGWSLIVIPDKESLISDSGKLHVLDDLLKRLKDEGHRVLIYSQMTKMIDLLEEYMWFRKHRYMRLDGSSRISDRRDMVADFQSRKDIFVFLLSTRAGGLGINLTAADTVIFFDSDWNPTVDQQAMDRAHRLGQTKQVTVYRLICNGSIEERILQRAQEKSEIQRIVIAGGSFRPDTLKPTEVVSLLLEDEELERKFKQRQKERKQMDEVPSSSGLATPKVIVPRRRRDREDGTPKRKYVRRQKKDVDDDLNILPLGVTGNDLDSNCDLESFPTSPYSEQSMSSFLIGHDEDDESIDGSLALDDPNSPFAIGSASRSGRSPDLSRLTPDSLSGGRSRGSGRSRGRPRGSRARGPLAPRGRANIPSAAVAAAELAGAQAGKVAALAAYASIGTLSANSSIVRPRNSGRGGRGRTRGKFGISFSQDAGPSRTSSSPGGEPVVCNERQ